MRNRIRFSLVWLAALAPALSCAQAPAPAPASPAQDPAQAFLTEVEAAVELHDWLRLLDMAEPGHREAQLKAGISHAQYVAELLGLNYEGNTLQPTGEALTSDQLLRIRQIDWKRRGRAGPEGWQSMLGTVSLKDGTQLLIEVHYVKAGEGYRLTGARG